MGLFGRRKRNQEPQHSPEYLAREAEIDRINDAGPVARAISQSEIGRAFTPPLIQALRNRDMQAFDSLYHATSNQEERIVWLNAARDYQADDKLALFQSCLQQNTGPSLMLAANIALDLAFEDRGEGTADTVTAEGAQGFADWNARARDLMQRSAQASNHTDPFAFILAQGATVEGGPQAMLDHAQQWQAIDPWNPMGWSDLARGLDARWSGDLELLPRMAVHLAENAPEGHPALVEALATLDQHWDYLWTFGELAPAEADELVWRSDLGLHVVTTAYERFAGKYQGGIRDNRHWDLFTYSFSMAGLHEEALALMRQQNGVLIAERWAGRYESPEAAYNSRRWKAIQATYRRQHPLPEDAYDDELDWGPRGKPVMPNSP